MEVKSIKRKKKAGLEKYKNNEIYKVSLVHEKVCIPVNLMCPISSSKML
jgi:hypothetical protein